MAQEVEWPSSNQKVTVRSLAPPETGSTCHWARRWWEDLRRKLSVLTCFSWSPDVTPAPSWFGRSTTLQAGDQLESHCFGGNEKWFPPQDGPSGSRLGLKQRRVSHAEGIWRAVTDSIGVKCQRQTSISGCLTLDLFTQYLIKLHNERIRLRERAWAKLYVTYVQCQITRGLYTTIVYIVTELPNNKTFLLWPHPSPNVTNYPNTLI